MRNCSTVPMQTIFEQPHCQCEQLACDHCLSVYRRRRRFLSEACGGGAVPTQPLFDQRHLQWQRGARCADHHQRRTNDGAQTAGQLAHHAPGKDCFPPFSTATVSTLAYDFRICWLIFLFYLPRDSVYLQTTLAMRVINSVMSAFRLFICFCSFCWTSWSFTSICYMCMGFHEVTSDVKQDETFETDIKFSRLRFRKKLLRPQPRPKFWPPDGSWDRNSGLEPEPKCLVLTETKSATPVWDRDQTLKTKSATLVWDCQLPWYSVCMCVWYEQKKLEGELQQIEEKHRAKKCKFSESSEQFYEQLARVTSLLDMAV